MYVRYSSVKCKSNFIELFHKDIFRCCFFVELGGGVDDALV